MVLLWLESIVRELATVKSLKADVLGLALRQSDWGSCGFCVRFYAENGATLLVGNMVKRKQE